MSKKLSVDERVKIFTASYQHLPDETRTSIRLLKPQAIAIFEQMGRLSRQQPGVVIRQADAHRSLIMLGIEAAREAERKAEREELSDD